MVKPRALRRLCGVGLSVLLGAIPLLSMAPRAGAQEAGAALTPNQQSTLGAIQVICPQLAALNRQQALDATEQQLLFRCNTILNANSGAASRDSALTEISPEALSAAPRANINFGVVQRANVVSRLLTLRQGSGISGGASGDENGTMGDGRLGVYFNVKDGFGSKDATTFESEYDVKSRGATLGTDYRISNSFVVGAALGFGWNKADFAGGGDLKTEGGMGSVYASWYSEHQALDLIGTFGSFSNDSRRHIEYTVASPARTDVIDSTADGSTRSYMSSVGLSYSYDLGRGPWHLGPELAVDYIHVNVHSFAETSGASPELDLSYGPQGGLSLQLQAGIQAAYSFSSAIGVFTPHLRATYIRETKRRQNDFTLRYVNDTKVAAQGINTSFVLQGDEPDLDYFRISEGISATFAHGISAFLDAESLVGYESIKYTEVALGVRFTF